MTSKSKRRHSDLSDYGYARVRDAAFDAVHALWRQRKAEGMEQKDVAARIGCSPSRLNRTLRGPGNWTLRTFGELVEGMNGEAEIRVVAMEEPVPVPTNYDAYAATVSRVRPTNQATALDDADAAPESSMLGSAG